MDSNQNTTITTPLTVFAGTLVHSTRTVPLQIVNDALIGVRGKTIIFIESQSDLNDLARRYFFNPKDVRYMKQSQFLIPGFVDTHIHAPQYAISGSGMDLQLLDWLEKYTFPTEMKYNNTKFAENVYEKVVDRTLKWGTTTACYYGTIHTKSTLILADVIDKAGQRAFVGKVNMDQNSPENYMEDIQTSIQETERFVEEINRRDYERISAIITPRFAMSCSVELMTSLGELAVKYDLPIQSHLSESKGECCAIHDMYPQFKSYADIYYQTKLLSNRTVMAHCIYLSDAEIAQLKETGTAVSHCPNSNITLKSGILDVRKLLDAGIKVGLGTDVSGGYHPAILDSIRQAVGVSKLLSVDREKYQPITYKEAFRMATLGGSEALGLDDRIGNFMVGKEFDALLIETACKDSPFDTFDGHYKDTFEDILQKFLFLGDDRNIKEVYVAGVKVKSK